MKRFLKLMAISLVSILCMTFVVSILSGSADASTTKTGPIPNGVYVYESGYFVFQEGLKISQTDIFENGWEIEGDNAREYVDNWLVRKAKIVKRDGKIYFECYKWRDFFDVISCSSGLHGTEDIYEIIYNEEEKTLVIIR